MAEIANQTAVVVGVGPGLGSALVKAFAREGYTVVAAARTKSAVASIANQVSNATGATVVPFACDATQAEDVQRLFDAVSERHGTLEVTVFNAGAFRRGDVVDTEPEAFEQCWRVGCFAGFLVGRAAARSMLERGRGTIIFTGATASLRGGAGFVNLASPKFALRALAQSMARELGPKGIHVAHVIIDGQIHSERYAQLLDARGPDSLLEPAAIADAYVGLHGQPRNAWSHEIDLRPWVEKF